MKKWFNRARWTLLAAVSLSLFACGQDADYDVIIRGGSIYDGLGGDPVISDLAITGDRIAVIGDLANASGGIEIDAEGLAVAPGIIKTPIHGRSEDQYEELNGMQPLGRVGEIKDIVDAVLYLADANFVTGVILPVDGGVSAGA